jgi:hypothetical protein
MPQIARVDIGEDIAAAGCRIGDEGGKVRRIFMWLYDIIDA